ncbi:lipopolysaccharide biosynthesis protein [Parabacteroides chinchillae]|uniref:Membrane protein involved in the export of O-antigen and teichoic acid n=1 Tax=Parabacteroides chinchillae TaxID=871327 RepID=A0A8G2BX44_9BACT|nr:lipopolysaccharide biosynthesis protein [Parabacteroides chinchillae]SEF99044.1 Membrane protein involved in the export of O-antigen and teichoic acid [Parabacteroides chinchillae]
MEKDTLKQKTVKGLFWGGVSNGVQQLLGVLFGIYLARILNAEDYGLVGMLAIFSGIAGTIINSGFTVALTNKQDVAHEDYNAVFWFTFFVGLVCYIILFFCAPFISDFYKRPELTNLSRVVFLSFFFNGCAGVSYTVLFRQLMVKKQAQIDITVMALSGIVGVTLAMKGYAYWALVFQSMIFICGGALLRFIFAPWKPSFDINFQPLKGMFSFSLKLFITNIFQQLNIYIFPVLLGRFYNATDVGFFTQGQKWVVMGSQSLWGMFYAVAQPVLVEASNNKERQINVFRKMCRFGAFVSFPVMFGLAFVSHEFVCIVLGEKWLPSVPVLQILSVWGAFLFLQILYNQLLIAHGRSELYLSGTIFQGLLQIVSVLIAFKWGIMVMVSVYVFSFLLSLLYWHHCVNQEIELSLKMVFLDVGTYLFIIIVTLIIVYFLSLEIVNIYLLIGFKIFFSAIIYLSLSYLLGSKILKDTILLIKNKSL